MKKKSKKTEEETSNVYVYYNILTHVMLFVDAFTYDDAMYKFDACNFGNRKDWKIFLELDRQPA
tara:strand:- start:2018 stop:2209 length:192 start_codon:yes stop_codon:yes gene_type:complete